MASHRKPSPDQTTLGFEGIDEPAPAARRIAKRKGRRFRSSLQKQKESAKAKELYEERKATGICVMCGNPNDRDRVTCSACEDRQKDSTSRRGTLAPKRRREKGLCGRCGVPSPERYYCPACCERARGVQFAKMAARKSAGLCTECPNPTTNGLTRCEICRARRKIRLERRRARRGASGLCLLCESPAATRGGKAFCLRHWLYRVALWQSSRGGGGAGKLDKNLLRETWEQQGGRCAYTGAILVPGENASLDHKMPVSRGGTNERTNLQFVTWDINFTKRNYTHEEFMEVCRAVVEHRPPEISLPPGSRLAHRIRKGQTVK